jgi:hypothetical protein
MKNYQFILSLLFLGSFIMGCTNESDSLSLDSVNNTTELEMLKKSPAIFADCEMFASLDTKTNFKPTAGNFDELYTGATFKNGLGAISESKPGDKDYNGGRWHVNVIKADVSPSKYLNACKVEDLDLDDFMSTSTYFECPLRPIRGNSSN